MSASAALGRQFHTEHDDRGDSGYVDAYDLPGGKSLGSLSYWHMRGRPGAIGVDSVDVEPTARRKGVATAMYDHLLQAKPGSVVVHDVGGMSESGLQMATKMQTRHPGRHKFENLG